MFLTVDQIQELIKIIDGNQLVIIAQELGDKFLTDYDKQLLKNNGIDYDNIYKTSNSSIDLSFHFGMLAESIGAFEANKIDYKSLKEYVSGGKYIPVTALQRAALDTIKIQSFSSLKTLNGKIFSNVNNIIEANTLKDQKQFLVDEVKEGINNKKTIRQIANDISDKTGDWSRDFDRIIETTSQNAFELGKASEIERKNEGRDPEVYKRVFKEACKYCIKAYLTNGIGSEPKIFKLSELRANGTNEGRKVADWLPVLGVMHPYCRCSIFEKNEGFIWNTETQSFSTPDPDWKPNFKNRKPILIRIGDKEFYA